MTWDRAIRIALWAFVVLGLAYLIADLYLPEKP